MADIKKWSMQLAGRELTVEIGKYAHQADASCVCSYKDTAVLATVVVGKKSREGVDYFPLTVDYEERFYAAGKIKGSRFMKREGRPTDEAILIARMIDRSIRPLFDQENRLDVQIILTVFSIDDENDPDIPAFIAASVALSISNVNWNGPIAGSRVGLIDGEFILNPSYTAREKSDLDFVAATTVDNKLIMIEAEAKEVKEDLILKAIEFAKKHNQKIIQFILDIQKEVGFPKKIISPKQSILEQSDIDAVAVFLNKKIPQLVFGEPKATKGDRADVIEQLQNELDIYLSDLQISKEKREKAVKMVKNYVELSVTQAIIQENKRVDNRALDEIRPLTVAVSVFPRTHGSAHFIRGETEVLSIVTLGSPGDVLHLDTMETEEKKYFMHHYNFPPYSVGEVSPLRGPGRREIGHGALVEKALRGVFPKRDVFPYTIRVVSEVLSSNGSSSMASTCAASLALMDAGVPIKRHVAGIAIGLASDEESYTVITDLQDLEDGPGGMDFKVCATSEGITAIQMDTKIPGLPDFVVEQIFNKMRKAINQILVKMNEIIPISRTELSPYAPRIYTLRIDPEKIGLVIGPAGKTINKIIDACNVEIDIEKDGTVMITSVSKAGADRAIKTIEDIVREVEIGDVFEGKVTKIMNFGAFVELTPTQEGMVHVSNLSNDYVQNIEDVVHIGDILKVKVIEKDEHGRINLIVDGVLPKHNRFQQKNSSTATKTRSFPHNIRY